MHPKAAENRLPRTSAQRSPLARFLDANTRFCRKHLKPRLYAVSHMTALNCWYERRLKSPGTGAMLEFGCGKDLPDPIPSANPASAEPRRGGMVNFASFADVSLTSSGLLRRISLYLDRSVRLRTFNVEPLTAAWLSIAYVRDSLAGALACRIADPADAECRSSTRID